MKGYKQFVRDSSKEIDAWNEVFFFDIISNPFGYLFYRLSGKKLTISYILTALTFVFKMSAAAAFFFGLWIHGFALYLIGSVTDNIDGKIARMINKKDPAIRSTTDFLGDMVAIAFIYAAMTYQLIQTNELTSAYLLIVYMALNIIYMTATSSKFRTQSLENVHPNTKLRDALGEKNTERFGFVFRLQKIFAKWRIPFYPTGGEAKFLITTIFPLYRHPALIVIAIPILILDMIAVGFFPTYALLTKKR